MPHTTPRRKRPRGYRELDLTTHGEPPAYGGTRYTLGMSSEPHCARLVIMDIISYAVSMAFTYMVEVDHIRAEEAHSILVDMLEDRRAFDIAEDAQARRRRVNRLGGHILDMHVVRREAKTSLYTRIEQARKASA